MLLNCSEGGGSAVTGEGGEGSSGWSQETKTVSFHNCLLVP
jgi:hypothetical protein